MNGYPSRICLSKCAVLYDSKYRTPSCLIHATATTRHATGLCQEGAEATEFGSFTFGGEPPEAVSGPEDASSVASTSTAALDVSGELVFIDTQQQYSAQWAIRTGNGLLTPIALGYEPPKTDELGQALAPGALVTISCSMDPLGTCNPGPGSQTAVLSAESAFLADTRETHQRMLVIILDYSACGAPAAVNGTAVRSIFLGPNGDGSGGVAEKYRQCSHGKLTMNTTAFTVITVKAACSDGVVQSCSYTFASITADAMAKGVLGQKAFSEFTRIVYVIPPRVPCAFSGIALLPGNRVWLTSGRIGGVYNWTSIMQEVLHGYGLQHAWQNGMEYDDYSTFMGRGDVCLTAPELAYLGWATPAPGGDRIDSSRLRVRTTLSFSLPATYLSPDGNYLRVVPDWLPSYSEPTVGKNLYIAVRVNKGGDALLGTFYANKVNIHELNASLDNNPLAQPYTNRQTTCVTAIQPRSQTNLTAYNLVVYSGFWVGGKDILRVHLCRYDSTPDECPSLKSLEPPLPPAPPRPPPPPPKPPSPTPRLPSSPRLPPSPRLPSSPRPQASPRPQPSKTSLKSPPPPRK
ncbi:metalloproteinase, extracellular matrix glycoprotein VMP6 [Volvox carteri f. nagariensis]|uniref:Metalloproteinase, extracellular matrix glycoprotein VMP6 n=1 Tax=Volvox carteri f. nagariensis TaxID=3068 RepID=D8U0A3_VOLCA|nr:metalloproteinase, extracellular matrix glycoprotein VMP6 [Volvox carteri f. nagariensis]EFJ46908.1 metalloproteinase, extracellular matrix glycoprotein VMP6 [Volvox carteri f. nagariensis]|eukprot:XP_002952117.1 metalloproteinase, extracellular matrix glycoprotein VMP6 [Volvox carteri f. nagariensis]